MADTRLAGTRVPRWVPPGGPVATGWDDLHTPVPPGLAAALRRLSPPELPTALLAAHLKVLAELSAERTVLTSYCPPGGTSRTACAATVADGPWQALLAAAGQAAQSTEPAADGTETLLGLSGPGLSGPGLSGPGLSGPGLSQPGLEAARTPADPGSALPDASSAQPDSGLALRVSVTGSGEGFTVHLRYRRDVMTADYAERITGYLLTALTLLTSDPGAPHHLQSLVAETELHTHMHGLGGRRVPDSGRLFVELFEEQAREHPDDAAALHHEQRWSYRDLSERSSQVANLLLARGLGPEDVVMVCMSRGLNWLAAMLGIFKAGGVYLPVRPDFPPDRIAAQLARSECRFALTEPGAAASLEQAAAQAPGDSAVLSLEQACRSMSTACPEVALSPGQLAYIYFTSGSTGQPKGAMCEHAGMINHLWAKVDDLDLAPGDVVTQIASQCFDISLWQLAAPLLVGGCTEIISTELQLDVERFTAKLAAGGIHVIQIVPAYLEVMLTHLESRPSGLGDVRSVSVTGEALKSSLVRRWFALYPQISLVNAYGATEVSDDTMHAVLRAVPERDAAIVHVGRSLRNINTYVLNDRLQVAPLGAPGEIAFSGVCVGRGYINDPDRTRQAFGEDPYRPGVRLYRTGDFGRWLPEGTIEFLGRRDEQVKIRGYRIEIGEIENRLLQMPGVREAAVIIDGHTDQTRHLVAFVSGAAGLQPADLRDFLAAALPPYMVPSYLHTLDALPHNDNGKVDKRQLITLASELSQDVAAYEPPGTATEHRLATAWAEILNVLVGRIGRGDDFFKLGGTSLAAVRLVVKLDRLISLRQLVAHPVLGDLAAVIDGAASAAAPSGPLLQRLSSVTGSPVATLVCFPYAGGNAVNFQGLARELDGTGIAVQAVELPGHDIAHPDEPLATVTEIASRVHAELAEVAGPLLIWGQCAGAAPAMELARLLELTGRPAARVFLGAALLEDPAEIEGRRQRVAALSNQEITAHLHADSAYVELDLLKSERSDLVGAAYRHDVRTSGEYLLHLLSAGAPRLRTSVVVAAAADDPATARYGSRYRSWQQIAGTVTLFELDDGGHYFVRTRAAQLADLVSAGLMATAGAR